MNTFIYFMSLSTRNRFGLWQLEKTWKKACKKAGFEGYTIQEGTRKSVTSNAIENGVDLKDISYALGNSPKILLEHYGQISAKRNVNIFSPDRNISNAKEFNKI